VAGLAIVNMSAPIAAQPQTEEAQDPIVQQNDAAHGLFLLAQAGGEQQMRNKAALPGIHLPIKQESELPTEGRRGTWRGYALPLTVRERIMIAVMAALKDKPHWERKVFDELIVDKWRQEALTATDSIQAQDGTSVEQPQQSEVRDATSHYNAPAKQRMVTERLFQYVSLCSMHILCTG
jgi:hypothetical protein